MHGGKYVIIEDGVSIGKNVSIGHHTVIHSGTIIGDNVQIGSNAVLGCQPFQNSRVKHKVGAQKPLIISNNCKIGKIGRAHV